MTRKKSLDERHENCAAGEDLRDAVPLGQIELRRFQALGRAEDVEHRRPKFVTRPGEKLGSGPVRGLDHRRALGDTPIEIGRASCRERV